MATRPLKSNDAYGAMLWDFHRGKRSDEIVERDDRFITFAKGPHGGPHLYFSRYSDWSPLEKLALRRVKGRVLDVGCGAGRHALYLQSKGHQVVGIDSSPLAVRVSKLRGVRHARVLPIDKVGAFPENSFDSIILMGNNFGLFSSFRKARLLLKSFGRITSKDGLIIAETTDPYVTTEPVHLAYHKRNRNKGRMSGQLRIRIRYRDVTGPWMDYLFVSENELKRILRGTGWKIKSVLRARHVPKARYVIVLQKRLQERN